MVQLIWLFKIETIIIEKIIEMGEICVIFALTHTHIIVT
jgi:hypothetical protein